MKVTRMNGPVSVDTIMIEHKGDLWASDALEVARALDAPLSERGVKYPALARPSVFMTGSDQGALLLALPCDWKKYRRATMDEMLDMGVDYIRINIP